MQRSRQSTGTLCCSLLCAATIFSIGGCGTPTGDTSSGDAEAFATQCADALKPHFDASVFIGANEPSSAARLLAMAYERDSFAAADGAKDRPRPDIRQVVLTIDGEDGFYCHLLSPEGFTAASMSTFGKGQILTYAAKLPDGQIEVVIDSTARSSLLRKRLVADLESAEVRTWIDDEDGARQLPGYRMPPEPGGRRLFCDHSSGLQQTLDETGRVIEQQEFGCEVKAYEFDGPARERTAVRYDRNGHRREEDWFDDSGKPGVTRFDIDTNDRGDWVVRRADFLNAEDLPSIAAVNRYIVYRD